MREIINNIMTFYDMQVADLGVLVANSKKALKEFSGGKKADRQAERIENFAKDLTTEINDMLTKFYFYKKRKQMTGVQTRVLVDFAAFVKALEKQVCSLLTRFEKSQTFAERMDKEIKELETHVRVRLKEYDEALRGTSGTLKYRLSKYVINKVTGINKFFRRKSFDLEVTQKAKLDIHQAHRLEDAPIDSIDSCDTQLENFINVLNIRTGPGSSEKSERQIHLEAVK